MDLINWGTWEKVGMASSKRGFPCITSHRIVWNPWQLETERGYTPHLRSFPLWMLRILMGIPSQLGYGLIDYQPGYPNSLLFQQQHHVIWHMGKDIGCHAIQTLEASSLKTSQTSSVDFGASHAMSCHVTSTMLDRDMYMCLSTRYDAPPVALRVLYCASITYSTWVSPVWR
jgi:hypothetical protein